MASAFLKLLVQVVRSLEQSIRSDVIVEAEGCSGSSRREGSLEEVTSKLRSEGLRRGGGRVGQNQRQGD